MGKLGLQGKWNSVAHPGLKDSVNGLKGQYKSAQGRAKRRPGLSRSGRSTSHVVHAFRPEWASSSNSLAREPIGLEGPGLLRQLADRSEGPAVRSQFHLT